MCFVSPPPAHGTWKIITDERRAYEIKRSERAEARSELHLMMMDEAIAYRYSPPYLSPTCCYWRCCCCCCRVITRSVKWTGGQAPTDAVISDSTTYFSAFRVVFHSLSFSPLLFCSGCGPLHLLASRRRIRPSSGPGAPFCY
jgi:hypothetical protein